MKNKIELLELLAKNIFDDSEINELSWVELVIVVDVTEGAVSQSGFAYTESFTEPVVVDSIDFDNTVIELRNAIQVDNKSKFKQMLLQMNSDGRIKCDFEYEEGGRWTIKPNNFKDMQEVLRPNFE